MQPEVPENQPKLETTPQESETKLQPLTVEESPSDQRLQWMIIGGTLLFLILLILAIVLMASNPEATEVIRDIAIVFVAVETFLIGLAIILLVLQVQALIKVLREEIKPLLESVNETASTVRGTTKFVSHNVVSPVIRMAGFTAAARRVASDVAGVVKGIRPRRKTESTSQEE